MLCVLSGETYRLMLTLNDNVWETFLWKSPKKYTFIFNFVEYIWSGVWILASCVYYFGVESYVRIAYRKLRRHLSFSTIPFFQGPFFVYRLTHVPVSSTPASLHVPQTQNLPSPALESAASLSTETVPAIPSTPGADTAGRNAGAKHNAAVFCTDTSEFALFLTSSISA